MSNNGIPAPMKHIGPLYFDRDSFFIGPPGKWVGIHLDLPWESDCRDHGAPYAIYLHLYPLGCVTVGLPDNRGGLMNRERAPWHWNRFQAWTPSKGYRGGRRPRVITFSPRRRWMCSEPVGDPRSNGSRDICGASRWHRGSCSGA